MLPLLAGSGVFCYSTVIEFTTNSTPNCKIVFQTLSFGGGEDGPTGCLFCFLLNKYVSSPQDCNKNLEPSVNDAVVSS